MLLVIFFVWEIKNLDINNKSNKSKIEIIIEFKDEINQDILIYQIKKASSQCQQDFIPMITLYILSYTRS